MTAKAASRASKRSMVIRRGPLPRARLAGRRTRRRRAERRSLGYSLCSGPVPRLRQFFVDLLISAKDEVTELHYAPPNIRASGGSIQHLSDSKTGGLSGVGQMLN